LKADIIAAIEGHETESPASNETFPGVNFSGEVTVEHMGDGMDVHVLSQNDLFVAVKCLKNNDYILSLLCASDEKAGPMDVLYSFIKLVDRKEDFREVRIRVIVPKADEEGNEVATICPSLADLFPAAIWHEREMYDMYGIKFEGNPDMRRMFLPEDWTGFPMRKDYSEPEQFLAMEEGEDVTFTEQKEGSW
jgi:NADH:ubiquinone oxidoreductase subunit C